MNKRNFVTLFDSLYLPQGLTLYQSLKKNIEDFELWVLCVDEKVYQVLSDLSLEKMRLIRLSELETNELRRVKKERTKAEYCWTLTPFAPKFVFERDPTIDHVTYIDADIWFYQNPSPIFEEFNSSRKHVLITEHSFSPEYDHTSTSGKYCVQFIVFRNSRESEVVRKWWEERCIEWCYSYSEEGKFGDQKYLEKWPLLFGDKVHTLQNKSMALAPWNSTRYPYSEGIFYHFHGLRVITKNRVQFGPYAIPRATYHYVYKPYLLELKRNYMLIEEKYNIKVCQAKSINIILDKLNGLLRGLIIQRIYYLGQVKKW